MTMFKSALMAAAFALLSLPQAASAQSGMLCAQRDLVLAQLTDRYGEQRHGMGLAPNNRIVEIYVSEETGSWTIILTNADGTTCLMAAGQHFEAVAPVPAGDDL
ncbi:hypothetical protein [Hasllibacter sp. MH4015]|uniref:hypothetical protein n=1 Tax=Hasllibacter sp. MH4015 TaxID=2854029 RepID=UPI001CD7F2CC|nr:hypothetical protein [Hasllibacter sp. MH4015]